MMYRTFVENTLNRVLEEKGIGGYFIANHGYTAGKLPIMKEYFVKLCWVGDKTVCIHEIHDNKSCPHSEYQYIGLYERLLAHIMLNLDEVWNLINTRHQ